MRAFRVNIDTYQSHTHTHTSGYMGHKHHYIRLEYTNSQTNTPKTNTHTHTPVICKVPATVVTFQAKIMYDRTSAASGPSGEQRGEQMHI